jgi:outer membrane protein TolC
MRVSPTAYGINQRNIEKRIRRRAFELYEQRGRVDGFALDDWLRAEREILGAQKPKVKAAKGSN